MRSQILALLALTLCPLGQAGDTAPTHALVGTVDVAKGELLASSFLVFSKLTLKGEEYDQPPAPLFQSLPVYPASALRSGVFGEATISFSITEEGEVADLGIENETAKDFGPASEAAILQWRFSPAHKNSKPVAVHARAKFIFSFFDKDGI